MKNAQISVNFTWIFGIIAGIALFIFLINFMTSERDSSVSSTNFAVLEKLEVGLKAASNTPNTFSQILAPKMNLRILCDDPASSGFSLEGAPQVKSKAYEIIFSPEKLSGNLFFAWSQDWNVPSLIERFLYLSNKELLFVVVKDEKGYWTQFLEKLPKNFPRVLVNLTEGREISNKGYESYRVIFFDKTKEEIMGADWNLQGEAKALSFVPRSEGLGVKGFVSFFDLHGKRFEFANESFYVGLPLVYGAAFSGDLTNYDCNLQKALFRLEMLTELNSNRTADIMRSLAGNRDICQEILNGNLLQGYLGCNECLILMKDLPNLYNDILAGINENEFESIADAMIEIDSISINLLKGRSCPTI